MHFKLRDKKGNYPANSILDASEQAVVENLSSIDSKFTILNNKLHKPTTPAVVGLIF